MRSLAKFIILPILVAGVGILTYPSLARAIHSYDRAIDEGYFAGRSTDPLADYYMWVLGDSSDPGNSGIYPGWQTTPTNVDNFIQGIEDYLYSAAPDPLEASWDHTGAAFIINTMLGHQGTDPIFATPGSDRVENGIEVARSMFADWEATVRYYDAQGWVEWNEVTNLPSGTHNGLKVGYSDPDGSGGYTYGGVDGVFMVMGTAGVSETVVFHNPGGTNYRIKKLCGNIVGDPVALQAPPSPPSANPEFDLVPSNPGVAFNDSESPTAITVTNVIQAEYTWAGAPLTPPDTLKVETNIRVEYYLERDGSTSDLTTEATYTGGSYPHGTVVPTMLDSGSGTSISRDFSYQDTFTTTVGQLRANDRVCARIWVNPSAGEMTVDGTVVRVDVAERSSSISCAVVGNQPYIKIFGNDVMAGGGWINPADSTCTINDGNTRTHFKTGSEWDRRGSSVQHAAFALGTITGFSSANLAGPTSPQPDPPSGLSFSNHSITWPQGGGDYKETNPCISSYFAHAGDVITSFTDSELESSNSDPSTFDKFYLTGDVTLGSVTIPQRARKILFVDGTVTINGNIIYDDAGSTWGGADSLVNNIPAFYLVARNIVIHNNVTQLDGVYIAEPDDTSNHGVISTCQINPSVASEANTMYQSCANQLTVNGALLAKKVNFLRTFGSLRNSIDREYNSPPAASCDSHALAQTAGTGTCAAEVIRFSPEVYFVPSPFSSKESGGFDAYSGLPPNF